MVSSKDPLKEKIQEHERWCEGKGGSRLVLDGEKIEGDVLSGRNLQGAIIKRCDLRGSVCDDANFAGADLSGTDMRKASFKNAILSNVKTSGARLQKTNFEGAIWKDQYGDEPVKEMGTDLVIPDLVSPEDIPLHHLRHYTLIAGPWVGELGWELFGWQGRLRFLSKKCKKTVIGSRRNRKCLYNDFADEFYPYNIPHSGIGGFKCNKNIEFLSLRDKYSPDDDERLAIMPLQYRIGYDIHHPQNSNGRFYQQEFVRYGHDLSINMYDIVVHARSTNKDHSSYRNVWGHGDWKEFLQHFSDKKVCFIGTEGDSLAVDGYDDLRDKPLESISNIIRNSKVVVGPSSGPMHLSALCGTAHVVFSAENWNKERYEEYWNPLDTPVEYIPMQHERVDIMDKVVSATEDMLKLADERSKTISDTSNSVKPKKTFDKIFDMYRYGEPFALARFNDGEMKVVDGMTGSSPTPKVARGKQTPTKSLQKELIRALNHRQENYWIGKPCRECFEYYYRRYKRIVPEDYPYQVQATELINNGRWWLSFDNICRYAAGRKVTWVSGENQYLGDFEDRGLDIKHIKVPEKDAWDEYDYLKKLKFKDGQIVILSCGPMSRVLTCDYFKANPSITVLDVGSLVDPLTRDKWFNCHTYDEEKGLCASRKCSVCNYTVEDDRLIGKDKEDILKAIRGDKNE